MPPTVIPTTTPTTTTPTTTPTTTTPTTTAPDVLRAAPPQLPRTGGSGRLGWWAAVVLLSGVGVVLNTIRPDGDRPR